MSEQEKCHELQSAWDFYNNGGYEYDLAEHDEGGYLGTNDSVAVDMLVKFANQCRAEGIAERDRQWKGAMSKMETYDFDYDNIIRIKAGSFEDHKLAVMLGDWVCIDDFIDLLTNGPTTEHNEAK